jgi:hypothetical protein
MAYQTGVIEYRGSFKSIRHWKNRKNRRILAGEKGGANRNLVMRSTVFARTRENMNEFGGCGVVVKAIRLGLIKLLPEHTDTLFTARLVKLIKMINLKDPEGVNGVRAIKISSNKTMLKSLNLHEKRKIDFELKRCIKTTHPDLRTEATITVNGFNPEPRLVPGNAQYYRVINHVSIISDYVYIEKNRRYEAISPLDQTAAFVYSDYTAVNTPLSAELKAAFPEGTVPGDADTVLQCVGVEFYNRTGADGYVLYSTGNMIVYDVF